MNLTLSENHAMLRQTVRAFVSSHVAPQATEWDHARALPEATLRALGELGLRYALQVISIDRLELVPFHQTLDQSILPHVRVTNA